jgi:DNA-binding protein H-NS
MYALEAKPPIKCAKFNKNNNLRDKTMETTLETLKELKQKAVQLSIVAEELKKNLTVAQAYAMNTGNETPEELKEDKLSVDEYLRRCIGSLQYIHDKRFSIQRAIEKTQ